MVCHLSKFASAHSANSFLIFLLCVGCPYLREIDVRRTSISDIGPLAELERHERVDVSQCEAFKDTSPLQSSHRHLRKLRVSGTAVTNPSPLACLPCLRVLCINDCDGLRVLSPLRGCYQLQSVDIRSRDIAHLEPLFGLAYVTEVRMWAGTSTSLSGLSGCVRLTAVYLYFCASLVDLSPMAGMSSLEKVDVTDSGDVSLTRLNTCANLKDHVVCVWGGCESLVDLSPLAGAPALTRLSASTSAVATPTGLHTCPHLRYVSFPSCVSLTDLSPLVGAPALERSDAAGGAVTVLTGLGSCPKLTDADVSGCVQLIDLSPLSGASSLARVDASRTGAAPLTELHTCPRLRSVNFEHCGSLR